MLSMHPHYTGVPAKKNCLIGGRNPQSFSVGVLGGMLSSAHHLGEQSKRLYLV